MHRTSCFDSLPIVNSSNVLVSPSESEVLIKQVHFPRGKLKQECLILNLMLDTNLCTASVATTRLNSTGNYFFPIFMPNPLPSFPVSFFAFISLLLLSLFLSHPFRLSVPHSTLQENNNEKCKPCYALRSSTDYNKFSF